MTRRLCNLRQALSRALEAESDESCLSCRRRHGGDVDLTSSSQLKKVMIEQRGEERNGTRKGGVAKNRVKDQASFSQWPGCSWAVG